MGKSSSSIGGGGGASVLSVRGAAPVTLARCSSCSCSLRCCCRCIISALSGNVESAVESVCRLLVMFMRVAYFLLRQCRLDVVRCFAVFAAFEDFFHDITALDHSISGHPELWACCSFLLQQHVLSV